MSDGEVCDEEAQRAVEAVCKERDELKARVAELERRCGYSPIYLRGNRDDKVVFKKHR